MQIVREITEEEEDSDVEYTTFESEENSGSVQHLQKEMQAEVFAALHLRSVEEDSPQHRYSPCVRCTRIFVMVVIVAFIWMAVSVPSILYANAFLSRSNSSMASNSTSNFTYSNVSINIYNGTACSSELFGLQACLAQRTNQTFNNSSICISSSVDQVTNENNAKSLERASGLIIQMQSLECLKELRPFVCLYLFPLVSCEVNISESSPEVYGPTQQKCKRIRDEVCQKIWSLAAGLFKNLLPDCENLQSPPLDLLDPKCTDNNLSNSSDYREINCTEGFALSNGSCNPQCQVWSQFSPRTILITDVLVISTAVFALVVSLTVLVLGCMRCRKIYSYPSIFIIYQTIPLMVLAVLVLIGFSARPRLFCSSTNLNTAFMNPSAFCNATGFAFHYFIVQLPFWWLCHVITVFLNTLFPYQMRRIECTKRLRCLHAFMVAAGILLPMGSMAAVAASGGFNFTRLPTYLCVGINKHVVFSVVIVPISVAIAIGSTLMIFILSTVIKRHIQAHVHHLRVRLDWTAEAKVFIVLIYYLILGVAIIAILTRALTNLESFGKEALDYFGCEAKGIIIPPSSYNMSGEDAYAQEVYEDPQNSTCDRTGIDRFSEPITTTIAFVLLGIYPVVYLIYTINCKELKEKLCTFTVREVELSNKTSTTTRRNMNPRYYSPMNYNSNTNTLASSLPGPDLYNRPSTFTPLST